jgi:nitrogen fixation NifU-like protein
MSKRVVFDTLTDAYEKHVLPHAHAAVHRGHLEFPSRTGSLRNPRCGDEVSIALAIDENGRITRACFEARGCLISQAAADLLCEHIEGRNVKEIAALRAETILNLLGVPLTAARYECALLALHCVRRLIDADGSPTKGKLI